VGDDDGDADDMTEDDMFKMEFAMHKVMSISIIYLHPTLIGPTLATRALFARSRPRLSCCTQRAYYEEKFGRDADEAFRLELAQTYVAGLQWVLYYYFRGVQSWGWYVFAVGFDGRAQESSAGWRKPLQKGCRFMSALSRPCPSGSTRSITRPLSRTCTALQTLSRPLKWATRFCPLSSSWLYCLQPADRMSLRSMP
jgi:hypothetical protein